jgi:hypothetical protein
MEDPMLKNLTNAALLTISVCLGIMASEARSEGLDMAIEACKANPKCTYTVPDHKRGMVFKIETAGAVKLVRCSSQGDCMRVMPRGQSFGVADILDAVKAQ